MGVLAMIDDGELDWKMIAINSEDPLFAKLNDIEDVETVCPGTVSGTYVFLILLFGNFSVKRLVS